MEVCKENKRMNENTNKKKRNTDRKSIRFLNWSRGSGRSGDELDNNGDR